MQLSNISVSTSSLYMNLVLMWAIAVNNVHVTVFLVSLKAGGVALNLTEASRVYLMDSWWNPAVSCSQLTLPLWSYAFRASQGRVP